eukprot:TRINITY_DN2000_c0_g1_i10.p1 TRINITY_DN2000_c0_g1~~TRINITY_DN2000_c0_g1_i10.p1  ORF type:complete len:417 (-),score=135.96 TRINITY_DN2000_c0_g1_i10:42-1292(-)
MGERKGQNFYYPPDFDPKKHGSLNGYHGVHALRERARKLDRGILIIRFEMPYNIWCGGCKKHIGMGVRYNAEKTKVGMYYTTPIYQFRMKCHLCTNHFSIKTDPANLDYVIVEGASRQERRWDPTENGQVVPDDKSVGRKLADDAMYKLEHEKNDKGKSSDAAPRIGQISDIQDRVKDDYLANRMLRDKFRRKKKQLLEKQKKNEELLKKASLDMDLVDECPEDVRFAQLLSLQARKDAEDLAQEGRDVIQHQDIFNHQQQARASPTSTSSAAAGNKTSKPFSADLTAREKIVHAATSGSRKLIKSSGFGAAASIASSPSAKSLGIVVKKKSASNNVNALGVTGKSSISKPEATVEKSNKNVEDIAEASGSNVRENSICDLKIKDAKEESKIVQTNNPLLMLSNYSDSSNDDDSDS